METRLPAKELDAVHQCFQRKHVDEQFYALAETLLWRNKAVDDHLDMTNGPGEGPNKSQCVFATVAMLDLQVPNGGLLQFFWNCPGWMDHVPESLRSIGMGTVADAFESSTAELVAQIGTYSEFRKRDSLEAYSECASEFSFDEFDTAYYDQQGQLYSKGIAFVSQHLADFVALRSEGGTESSAADPTVKKRRRK